MNSKATFAPIIRVVADLRCVVILMDRHTADDRALGIN